jgi:hypothetical protein
MLGFALAIVIGLQLFLIWIEYGALGELKKLSGALAAPPVNPSVHAPVTGTDHPQRK